MTDSSQSDKPTKKNWYENQALIIAVLGVVAALLTSLPSIIGALPKKPEPNQSSNSLLNILIGIMSIILIGIIVYEVISRWTKNAVRHIKKVYPKLSIVGIMRIKKANSSIVSMIIIMTSLIIYYLAEVIIKIDISMGLIYACLLLTVLLAIDKLSFDYRIKKGLYGNNEKEAREIIYFILMESKNIDFTDRGKPKKIISDNDLEEILELMGPKLLPTPENS